MDDVPSSLRSTAELALREFLGEAAPLQFLGHGQSLACRVDATSGHYLLRVHVPLAPPSRPAFFTAEALESECLWLQALAEEAELIAPVPLAGPDGAYVLLAPNGDDEPVPCTLLSWVDGQLIESKRTPSQARLLGELLADLRTHSAGWTPPNEFVRPRHDCASWHAALRGVDELVSLGIASAAQRALFTRFVERATQELEPLSDDPSRVGLIHADLHGGNYVEDGGRLSPIDFGLCGFGPWLWDVAESMTHLGPAQRQHLVEAYARRHPLEEADYRRLEGYFLATLIEMFGYRASEEREHEFLGRAIPAWTPHFERYVNDTPFLFEL